MQERKTLVTTEEGKEIEIKYPDALTVEKFSPLLERVEKEQPELLAGLIKLYEKIGLEAFGNYINNLISIKKHEQEMLIITHSSRQRSIIEREFLPQIKDSFDVTRIRIIAQD